MIPKSTKNDRLKENWDAQSVTLASEDIEAINGLDKGHRYFNPELWDGGYGWKCEPAFK